MFRVFCFVFCVLCLLFVVSFKRDAVPLFYLFPKACNVGMKQADGVPASHPPPSPLGASLFRVLCFVFFVLCFVFRVLCSVFSVLYVVAKVALFAKVAKVAPSPLRLSRPDPVRTGSGSLRSPTYHTKISALFIGLRSINHSKSLRISSSGGSSPSGCRMAAALVK